MTAALLAFNGGKSRLAIYFLHQVFVNPFFSEAINTVNLKVPDGSFC